MYVYACMGSQIYKGGVSLNMKNLYKNSKKNLTQKWTIYFKVWSRLAALSKNSIMSPGKGKRF